MRKLVTNPSFGGFLLSEKALQMLSDLKGREIIDSTLIEDGISREDTDLVTVIETLGKNAHAFKDELKITEIRDDFEYEIDVYDGKESLVMK